MAQQYSVGRRSTTIATEKGTTRVTYHQTVVVAFSDKKIILDSGGWRTATTKTRMNQASVQFGLGFSVFQRRFEWFVDWQGKELPFRDGMVLRR